MLMNGDNDFDSFFKSFFNPICLFIERIIGVKEDVTDLAQDVFLRVFERWKDFETQENAKAFLYISARNLCFDKLKRRRAEENYVSNYLQAGELDQSTFLKEVIRQETFRILHSAIDQLPDQTRQVILLCMEGGSNLEVSDKLGVSINTVKTLKKNGYAVLRDVLSKEYIILLSILFGDF